MKVQGLNQRSILIAEKNILTEEWITRFAASNTASVAGVKFITAKRKTGPHTTRNVTCAPAIFGRTGNKSPLQRHVCIYERFSALLPETPSVEYSINGLLKAKKRKRNLQGSPIFRRGTT